MKLLKKFHRDHSISDDYLEKFKAFFHENQISISVNNQEAHSLGYDTILVFVKDDQYEKAQVFLNQWLTAALL